MPEGSFYRVSNSALVMSPEFMFLCVAETVSFNALIAYGCELCGLYAFDPTQQRGFRKRVVPLMTKEQLRVFLDGAWQCRGRKKALRALPYIVERSASPMETFDALAMCLPYRLGGYSFEQPKMNYEVKLSARAARIAKRKTCYADMCYISANGALKLDIEHHGKLDHSSFEDQDSDRARVNGLKEMGFEVIELTYDQVEDLVAFEYIIQRVCRLIGKRIRKEYLGATPSRLAFRNEVLAWNRSYGKLC